MAKKDVSLLPGSPLQGTVLGKLFNWLLSVGRYIVIFVDLVVMGAFISRFWLDKKRIDLADEIRQQQAILETTQEFEQEFRNFQSRLNQAGFAMKDQGSLLRPLDQIVDSLPRDVVFLQYGFDASKETKTATVLAMVFSEASLNGFANNLLTESNVASVKIGTIEREQGEAGMKVQFLITFSELKSNG